MYCMYFIQLCLIFRPSDFTVSEDAGIESRTVATSALAVRRSSLSDELDELYICIRMYCTLYMVALCIKKICSTIRSNITEPEFVNV
jgi:hypothetical protein